MNAAGTDLQGVLTWFYKHRGHRTLLRKDAGPEGLFLWKVRKAKGAEFAKHPGGPWTDTSGTQSGESARLAPGWEMTNKCEQLRRVGC